MDGRVRIFVVGSASRIAREVRRRLEAKGGAQRLRLCGRLLGGGCQVADEQDRLKSSKLVGLCVAAGANQSVKRVADILNLAKHEQAASIGNTADEVVH